MEPRVAVALFAMVTACVLAGTSSATPTTVRVVHRGQLVSLSHTFPPTTTTYCVAAVEYLDDTLQQTAAKQVSGGRVSFAIRIPRHAILGAAHWSIRCGPVWQTTGTWRVARAVPAT
jgi:hypothetical protein